MIDALKRLLPSNTRLLDELRGAWGKPGTKDRWLESRCFDLTRDQSPAGCVDERTWSYLEFPRIYAELDSTVTPLGSQVLFRHLRVYQQDARSAARARETFEALRSNQGLREQIQLALVGLRADSAATIADSLFGQPLRSLRFRAFIHAWSALSVLTLVSVFAFSLTPFDVVTEALEFTQRKQ